MACKGTALLYFTLCGSLLGFAILFLFRFSSHPWWQFYSIFQNGPERTRYEGKGTVNIALRLILLLKEKYRWWKKGKLCLNRLKAEYNTETGHHPSSCGRLPCQGNDVCRRWHLQTELPCHMPHCSAAVARYEKQWIIILSRIEHANACYQLATGVFFIRFVCLVNIVLLFVTCYWVEDVPHHELIASQMWLFPTRNDNKNVKFRRK
jgi:hypothetical protein